jgi:hypothetical protein
LLAPLLIFSNIKVDASIDALHNEIMYQEAINKATDDATAILLNTSEHTRDGLILQPELAIDQFFNTLAINMSAYGDYQKEGLKGYVPCIAIVDIDGAYFYYLEEKHTTNGLVIDYSISPKQPYTIFDANDNVISMSLDDHYVVLDLARNITFRGTYNELRVLGVSDFFDKTPEAIEEIKTKLVVHILEENCGYFINQHNMYADIFGISYDFMLPVINESQWSNTVSDISILAFVQGLPLGSGGSSSYSTFSIGGAGIIRAHQVEGYLDPTGKLMYHWDNCQNKSGDLQEVFENRQDAAAEGYYPCRDCN